MSKISEKNGAALTNQVPNNGKDSKVSFHSQVQVVLTPTRDEYKKATCDLWWSKSDYLSFQQASQNEIRLYGLFHNLQFREARRQLYQSGMECGLDYGFMNYLHPIRTSSEVSEAGPHPALAGLTMEMLNCPEESLDDIMQQQHVQHNDHLDLYVSLPGMVDLKSDEANRHDYYNRTTSLVSKLYWGSAGGAIAILGMASLAVPLVGYYLVNTLH
ncbi:hypothetical protein EON65_38610 [archaeon]|nr:MAG: hypothetical protein EON65_38610 [archaeon]